MGQPLHLHDVPDEVLQELSQQAAKRQTSVADEAIDLLAWAIRKREEEISRHLEALAEIRRHAWTRQPGEPSVVDMIREDRDR